MTDQKERHTTDPLDPLPLLEPVAASQTNAIAISDARANCDGELPIGLVASISGAISLKRIADALERIAKEADGQ